MENERIYVDILYDIEENPQRRLAEMQEQLSECLDQNDKDLVIVNIGSGCARETINILKHRDLEDPSKHIQYKQKIEAHIIDLDREICSLIQLRSEKYNIPNLHVYQYSGSVSNAYIWNNIPRADIVIFGEMFTWMSLEDAENTIKFFSQICKTGASIIWTKDLTSDFYGRPPTLKIEQNLRKLFKENGFAENYFLCEPEKSLSIGRYTYKGEEKDIIPDQVIFNYVERQRR